MTLTKDQQIAESFILSFIDKKPVTDDDYLMTLSGFAGTGKSTLINKIIIKKKYEKKLCVSATTHKAKEVIAEITGLNADTIQALLGLKPNIELADFNPNKPVFDTRGEERIKNYQVVFIDEASMINNASFKLIAKKAIEFKTKIIFIGDKYQLPPVGEVISKVFTIKNIVSLEEIVRQSNSNPNQKLIKLARNDVRDNTDTSINYLNTVGMDINGEEGFKALGQEEYYNHLLESYYDSEYQQNPNIAKTIAWTNDAVSVINQHLRKNIINSEEAIAVGDILMGYKSISKEIDAPPFYLPIVKNSVDYIVVAVELIEKQIMGTIYKGYQTILKDARMPMFILHKDSYDAFRQEMLYRHTKAKDERRWKQYYDFKEQIVLQEKVVFGSGIDQKCDKDIDYGYALTVHKSQGSTYQNVGVTLNNINKNRTPQERRQLIYVALSRTSKRNYIRHDIPN